MSLVVLAVVIAAAVLVLFAVSRVLRVRAGMDARADGWKFWALFAAVLIVPPIALAVLAGPSSGRDDTRVIDAVVAYFAAVGVLAIGMGVVALLIRQFAPAGSQPTLMLALIGREARASDVPVNPAMTPELAASVALVEQRNAAFVRGPGFVEQTSMPGFAADWDALDEATRGLEKLIAERIALGAGVAQSATATAADARSRLETLRQAAAPGGFRSALV
jgi:hypothetical protein